MDQEALARLQFDADQRVILRNQVIRRWTAGHEFSDGADLHAHVQSVFSSAGFEVPGCSSPAATFKCALELKKQAKELTLTEIELLQSGRRGRGAAAEGERENSSNLDRVRQEEEELELQLQQGKLKLASETLKADEVNLMQEWSDLEKKTNLLRDVSFSV